MSRRQPSPETLITESIPHNGRLLVAVSGGKDSVVLLHLLTTFARMRQLSIEVAHVNHGLRPESGSDAEFVGTLAASLNLPFHRLDAVPPKDSTNIEAWGRSERYSYFGRVCIERELQWTITAHTANDVAETLLMRICANKETGSILARDDRRRVLRPLLKATRDQIDEYAQLHEISWREDSSNHDTSFTRNMVRHDILPVLKKAFGESIVRTIAERGLALGEEDLYFGEQAEIGAIQLIPVRLEDSTWLKQASLVLMGAPVPIRWRIVEQLLLPLIGHPIGARRAVPVVDLLLKGGGKVDLGGGVQVVATSSGISLSKEGAGV